MKSISIKKLEKIVSRWESDAEVLENGKDFARVRTGLGKRLCCIDLRRLIETEAEKKLTKSQQNYINYKNSPYFKSGDSFAVFMRLDK